MNQTKISAHFIDIVNEEIYPAMIIVEDDIIKSVVRTEKAENQYILPGFIDAHVHIESSMLIPSEFARLAVVHGTVATVSDPHEIANVTGMKGVEYMIDNGKKVPFKFYFGAPSCVPATIFETAGANLSPADVETLLQREDVHYLAEMMNWPGVLNHDPEVMQKIAIAKKYNKPVDGHAPGLKGETARKYIVAGMSTDHECFTKEEALDKLSFGMKIIIREGSAAKNFEALIDLIDDYSDRIMFGSDDKHPDELVLGHINELVKRAIGKDKNLFKVLKAACINPVSHYSLKVGLLKEGDAADFILIDNTKDFNILETYINGQKVAEKGRSNIESLPYPTINQFNISEKKPADFQIQGTSPTVQIIEALDGQLITNQITAEVKLKKGNLEPDVEKDLLKIVVVNRYHEAKPAVAFIKNFGIKNGALASSIAHDSHNIIAVGTDDEHICTVVNAIIKEKGGISISDGTETLVLPLPVAGIMSNKDGYEIADAYSKLHHKALEMGSQLRSPFMTLSFMALLVIPSIKLSDKGLFDGDKFRFIEL